MTIDANQPAAGIPSPCVRNCCLDENDICLGCNRSLTEICSWSKATAGEKQDILARCRLRAAARRSGPAAGPRKPW